MNRNTQPMKMTFVGGGNMAEALLSGMLEAGEVTADGVTVTDIREERLAELRERFGVHTSADNATAVADANMVWLCVKPQQMEAVVGPLAGQAPGALFVSIAAGVATGTIEQLLGEGTRVARVMPNTPALVGEGAAGIAGGRLATREDVERVRTLMSCVGKAVVGAEVDLHAVTALSGSGPAYVFYLVEAMLRGAVAEGLDGDQARDLAVQTVIGAGRLLEETGLSASELRRRVTSKGGTTAAALAVFETEGVGEGLTQGVRAAAARSRELAGDTPA